VLKNFPRDNLRLLTFFLNSSSFLALEKGQARALRPYSYAIYPVDPPLTVDVDGNIIPGLSSFFRVLSLFLVLCHFELVLVGCEYIE
jgi:hypothetical protein